MFAEFVDGERLALEPGEDELVARLVEVTERYRELGDRFFTPDRTQAERVVDYVGRADGPGSLLACFRAIKDVTEQIRRLNQASMESASREARAAASSAQRWSLLGLLAATAATGLLTWHAGRTILRPVEELTRSVRAIGEGRLSRQLQVTSHDELGLLVESFNRMTAQLRDLRQSESDNDRVAVVKLARSRGSHDFGGAYCVHQYPRSGAASSCCRRGVPPHLSR